VTNTGLDAETLAAMFLQQQGLKLLGRNYRCRFGEIDLVMRDREEVVFVEVRMRRSEAFGGAGASITPSKQRKLMLTAEHYLQAKGTSPCRFDAVLMKSLQLNEIIWLKNAFQQPWN